MGTSDPNPTGSTYLSANQNYIWMDGDVYQIAQTDTVEGAGAGASFGGLGVANQPHQQLLNKLQYLYNHLQTDEGNISALEALFGLISSDVEAGWLKVGASDSLGLIQIIWQWGVINLLPYGLASGAPTQVGNGTPGSGTTPGLLPFSFPISYPHAVWMILPYWQTNTTRAMNADRSYEVSMYDLWVLQPFGLTTNNIACGIDDDNPSIIYSAYLTSYQPSGDYYDGITGIGWISVGY
jgi:hypothetical protein